MFSLMSCESSMHQAWFLLLLNLMYNTRLQSLRQVPCRWAPRILEQLERWVIVSTILRRMQWKVGSITANVKRQMKAITHHEAPHLLRRAGKTVVKYKFPNICSHCDAEIAILDIGSTSSYLDGLLAAAKIFLQTSCIDYCCVMSDVICYAFCTTLSSSCLNSVCLL